MKPKELERLGIPRGACAKEAGRAIKAAAGTGAAPSEIRARLRQVVGAPDECIEDPVYGKLAGQLAARVAPVLPFTPRSEPAPYRIWGNDLDDGSLAQMRNAAMLPVSVIGALMPDAHTGYGLPIGGVLATDGVVIPYAVGMDIACRMKMTVLDLPPTALQGERVRLCNSLERETCFGVGASFRKRREHGVMDEDWSVSPVTKRLRDKAWTQLGSSGSGNHFVEYGELEVFGEGLGLAPGKYLALLSHSGSRGTGGEVAKHYSRLAMNLHPELPKELVHLAWLELSGEAGQEYWGAMELMGHYAAANHELIHRNIREALGVGVLLDVENHHNFAWREIHETPDGRKREVIVHRKGATPAGKGVLGIIPGSMGTPGYVVRGKGEKASLESASHGAGRRMSRTQAKARYKWQDLERFLSERGVELLSAGIDEIPMAYKDIDEVMAAQADLVETVARFSPRLVKMAPGDERPED
jgi:tRNA-splicing ligase RtcB